jgi:glycosyltransferase involved in cell wall biosynthesis
MAETAPFLSFCVPNYNMAPWLGRAVESALAVTGHDLEVVVLENASTDDSAVVARAFLGDERFRLVECDEHLPMMENWNRAVRATRGTWVVLLSADDVVEPVLADIIAEAAARGATLIGANSRVTNEAGDDIGVHPGTGSQTYEGREGLARVASGPYHLCAAAFRRSDFDAVGGFDPRWLSADRDFFIRVAALPGARPMMDDRIAATYYADRGSTWGRLARSGDDVRVMGEMLDARHRYADLGIGREVNRTYASVALASASRDLAAGDRATAVHRLRGAAGHARGLPRAEVVVDLVAVRVAGRRVTPALRRALGRVRPSRA